MANFTIPSLLPNIKAAKISARNDAYTNPQAVVDRSYEIFNKGMQQAIASGVTAMNNNAAYRKAEIEDQARLRKESSSLLVNEQAKVQGLARVGNPRFEQNKQNYMYALKERVVELKNAMDKNPELQQDGARAIAQINRQILEFKAAAPNMVTAINTLKERLKIEKGKYGAIASENASDIQRILLGMDQGDADITLVTGKYGNLVLYMPEQTYTTEDGEEVYTTGAQFDISAFNKMSADGGELFQTVPDIGDELKGISDQTIKVAGGETDNPLYYEVVTTDVGSGYSAKNKVWRKDMGVKIPKTIRFDGKDIPNPYYDPEKPDTPLNGLIAAKQDLIINGSLNSIIDPKDATDRDMAIIYQDLMEKGMGKGLDQFAWGETPPKDSEYTFEQVKAYQQQQALKWLSNRAIDDYGISQKMDNLVSSGGGTGGTAEERKASGIQQAIETAWGKATDDSDESNALADFDSLQGYNGMTIVAQEQDNGTISETVFKVMGKSTANDKQAELLEFDVTQPDDLNKLYNIFGLTPNRDYKQSNVGRVDNMKNVRAIEDAVNEFQFSDEKGAGDKEDQFEKFLNETARINSKGNNPMSLKKYMTKMGFKNFNVSQPHNWNDVIRMNVTTSEGKISSSEHINLNKDDWKEKVIEYFNGFKDFKTKKDKVNQDYNN